MRSDPSLVPSYLRTAARLALLTGSLGGCASDGVPLFDASSDAHYCSGARIGDPCPTSGVVCFISGGAPLECVRCVEPPFQNPRWAEEQCTRGGPLPPPELPA